MNALQDSLNGRSPRRAHALAQLSDRAEVGAGRKAASGRRRSAPGGDLPHRRTVADALTRTPRSHASPDRCHPPDAPSERASRQSGHLAQPASSATGRNRSAAPGGAASPMERTDRVRTVTTQVSPSTGTGRDRDGTALGTGSPVPRNVPLAAQAAPRCGRMPLTSDPQLTVYSGALPNDGHRARNRSRPTTSGGTTGRRRLTAPCLSAGQRVTRGQDRTRRDTCAAVGKARAPTGLGSGPQGEPVSCGPSTDVEPL